MVKKAQRAFAHQRCLWCTFGDVASKTLSRRRRCRVEDAYPKHLSRLSHIGAPSVSSAYDAYGAPSVMSRLRRCRVEDTYPKHLSRLSHIGAPSVSGAYDAYGATKEAVAL